MGATIEPKLDEHDEPMLHDELYESYPFFESDK